MKTYPNVQSTRIRDNRVASPVNEINLPKPEEPVQHNNINTLCQRLEQLVLECATSAEALESTISGVLSPAEPAKTEERVERVEPPITSPCYNHLFRIGLLLNSHNEHLNNLRRRSTL